MLRYYLFSKHVNYPSKVILQQYWAPSYYVTPVRQYFDYKLSNRYMGSEGPIPWPFRSLALTRVTTFSGVNWRTKYSASYSSTFLTSRKKSSCCCDYFGRNKSKNVQAHWKQTFICNSPKWGSTCNFIWLEETFEYKHSYQFYAFKTELCFSKIRIF